METKPNGTKVRRRIGAVAERKATAATAVTKAEPISAPFAGEPTGSDPWPPHWRELARAAAAWRITAGAPPGSLAIEAVLALTECGDLSGLKALDNLARIRLDRPPPKSELARELDWLATMVTADHAEMSASGMVNGSIADVLARNLLAYVASRSGPLLEKRTWVLIDASNPEVQKKIGEARDAINEALSPTDSEIKYGDIVKAGLATWGYNTKGWYEHTRKATWRNTRKAKARAKM